MLRSVLISVAVLAARYRHESGRKRPLLLESSGSLGYDGGLRSDKCEIPVEGIPGGPAVVFYGWSWMP